MRPIAVLPLVLIFLAVDATAQTARDVFDEVERRQRLVANERAEIEMRIEDARGRTRSRAMTVYTRVGNDDRQRSLIVFTAPADIRGTGLLTVETAAGDDQRLYLPTVGRVQRVAGAQRTERFAGSDFTYEDLGTRDPAQYDVQMVERLPDAFIIEARPKDATSQYSRIRLTVDGSRFVVTRAEHFDRRDRHVKTLTADGFSRVAPDVYRAGRLVMEDHVSSRRTELSFSARETGASLSDDIFTERQLRRGAP